MTPHSPLDWKPFLDLVLNSPKVVITTHIHPDADGIGAQIALCLALRQKGVDVVCVNELELLSRYHYLDASNVVTGHDEFSNSGSELHTLVVVDTNSTTRIGEKMQALSEKFEQVCFLDHHPMSTGLTQDHFIDVSAAATSQMVGELIHHLSIEWNQEMALPLYTGIIIDTSSFRYPTVSARTHAMIAQLLSTGIRPDVAYNFIYGTKGLNHMRMLGSVLRNAHMSEDQRVGWILMTPNDLTFFGIDFEDTHAFINNLLILENIQVACMFRVDHDLVRLSLRSNGDVDVGELAAALGGGGHSHSAATVFPMTKGKTLDRVAEETVTHLLSLMDR